MKNRTLFSIAFGILSWTGFVFLMAQNVPFLDFQHGAFIIGVGIGPAAAGLFVGAILYDLFDRAG